LYQIDNQSRQAVYEQIVQQVEKYVLTGILKGGDKLPSVRNLSVKLNVNPNTVQRAYTELERNNTIITSPGRGAFISDQGATDLKKKKEEMSLMHLKALISDLKLAGFEKSNIIKTVEDIYQEGPHD